MADPIDPIYWRLLVLRCQVGDRAALAELVAYSQPRLRGFLFNMVGDRENLDDLEQDIWADIFRDLPRLNDASAFFSWMFRIARNRVARALRRKTPLIFSDENIVDAPDGEEPPGFTADDAQRVHTALNRLAQEHREVILLRFIEHMSYEEIATIVDCPVGTVKSRIHGAKRVLRQLLESEDCR
jgi:RNA polymerase sigma-70 factor (ECF subfamily)